MSARGLCIWFALAAVLFVTVDAFATGAPKEACLDLTPQHGVSGQGKSSPYSIHVSKSTSRSQDPLILTISSIGPPIKGFLAKGVNGEDIIGKFSVPLNDKYIQTLNCGQNSNAATHRMHDGYPDQKTVQLTWIPPANYKGPVEFKITVVQDFEHFWIGQKSGLVKIY